MEYNNSMNANINLSNTYLITKRCELRPFTLEDTQDVFNYASAPEVGFMAGWKTHQSLEDSTEIVQIFIDGNKTLAIKHQDKVIGSIGLEKMSFDPLPEKLGREIGYVLGKDYWGQGLMVEVVNEVIRYCFEELKLDFLTVNHYDFNTQSQRVIEKCGFRLIAHELIESKIHGKIYVKRYLKER